jgi:phospholipase/carboxylesterase
MSLVHRVREPAGAPAGALVLLHGRGVDENDLHPLLDAFDPERRLLGVTPGAPLTNVPPGGRHWYVIERIGHPDVATFMATMEAVSGFVDDLLAERGIAWERAVLGGFSQGGAIAAALALGAGRPRPAGILEMSTFLPHVEGWPIDLAARQGLPAYITHGAYDEIIPVRLGQDMRDELTAGGLDVTYREPPVPHAIDPSLVPEIAAWVGAATGASSPERT